MFNKGIHGTVLVSEAAGRLFSNITDSGSLDQSFLATLRALLRKRLPQNETMQLTCRSLFQSVSELESVSASHCFTWFLQNAPLHPLGSAHQIHIVSTVDSDAGTKMLEIVKANAGAGKRFMVDFTRQDDLHVFFARKAKALFYTHNSGNSTIIFTDKLELKHFHALQMMIPKYLPRLFANSPLTEPEVALLKSLGNKSAVEYETLLGKLANDVDIRTEIIRSKLAGFATVFERMRADELRNEISTYRADYENYLSMMREVSNKIQDCEYTLAGIECAMNDPSGDTELMEYFMCNKNLSIIQVRNTAIDFIAHGYADVFDEEAFERYARNQNSFLYTSLPSDITKPQMEKLYRAVFSTGDYKLRICAAYRADMKTGLSAYQHYSFPVESQTYFPNTHIQQYACIGTYAGRFQEYMQRRDYVGAIDQAVVSARNLNFHDATVMSVFARDFSRSRIKCLEKSDGTLLTPAEAIMELHQNTVIEVEGDDECHDPLF